MSAQLHRWIDLTFGHQLSGEAAMAAKNVTLPSTDPGRLQSVGRAQLFWTPHPPRDAAVSKQVPFKCHDMAGAAPAGNRCTSRPPARCWHASLLSMVPLKVAGSTRLQALLCHSCHPVYT